MSLFREYVYAPLWRMLFYKPSEDIPLIILEVFVSNVVKSNFKEQCHIASRSCVAQLSNCGKPGERQSNQ